VGTTSWGAQSIPDQSGKTAVVTGATSGIGEETARVLAAKNAHVVLAVRNMEKGERVAADIRRATGNRNVAVQRLDLASLASIKTYAENFARSQTRLDLLIANAGVMFPPYTKTEDGFELQFGTNHLGHFALAGRLASLLYATQGARLVVVASLAQKAGKLDFADLNWESRKYNSQRAYCDSKLANLLFAYEYARRLREQGKTLRVTAAHPGVTSTELMRHVPVFRLVSPFLSQSAKVGALPTLRAACDPQAQSGDYYGPSGMFEFAGPPIKVPSNAASHDEDTARRLWTVSEQLTGVAY
jgi:NAD(P)-dependent dehydrogenase (short-subunit alcohol dehydrogenase family)